MAVMIWLAVFPTIAAFQQILGGLLVGVVPLLRALVLVSLTVPIVVYVLLPRLMRLRARVLARYQQG